MAVVIPDGFAEFTVNWTHFGVGQPYANVFGADVSAADSPAAAMLTVRNAIQDNLFTHMDISTTWVSVEGRFGPVTGPSPGPNIEIPEGGTGALSITVPPPQVTLLVKKITALGGRANRGRFYWPGMLTTTALNENGSIETGALANYQSYFDDFFDQMETGDGGADDPCPLVILHDETSPTTTPTLLTGLVVDGRCATQRRRLRG